MHVCKRFTYVVCVCVCVCCCVCVYVCVLVFVSVYVFVVARRAKQISGLRKGPVDTSTFLTSDVLTLNDPIHVLNSSIGQDRFKYG